MTFDRALSIAGLFAVFVAASASTFQGYMSWQGRNDYLKSVALAQVVRACADFARSSVGMQSLNVRDQGQPFLASFKEIVIAAMPLSTDTVDELQNDLGALGEFAHSNDPVPASAPEVQHFISSVDRACTSLIRANVGSR